jgi:hypothetical protein
MLRLIGHLKGVRYEVVFLFSKEKMPYEMYSFMNLRLMHNLL